MLIATDWVIDSCGAGSKGDRRCAWAWIATADPCRHLLIRRSLVPNAKGVREVAFHSCFAPEDRPVTLRGLIKVAGRRWPVEEDFQLGKDAFGLDHSQVRTPLGAAAPPRAFHGHHLALTRLATPPSSPRPLVPPTNPPQQTIEKIAIYDCRTREANAGKSKKFPTVLSLCLTH